MTDEIRKILDPGCMLSDDDVQHLLTHALKKKSQVWQMVLFLHRHHQLELAMDWLRELGDTKLYQLADVLPRLFEELDRRNAGGKHQGANYYIQKVGQLNPSASGINNYCRAQTSAG